MGRRIVESFKDRMDAKDSDPKLTKAFQNYMKLYIQDSDDVKYYLLHNVKIPVGASLLLDSDDMLSFNNTATGYSLNLTTATTSDLIDVLIKK